MLSIYFGDMEGALDYPGYFFDNIFDKSLLLEEFSKSVIRRVDKSEVFDKNVVISPVLGGISPRDLSTGVKNTLICRYYPEKVICFSYMGRNCLRPLFEEIVNKGLDRTICANILYIPYTYGYEGEIKILNSGRIVNNNLDFIDEFANWKCGE